MAVAENQATAETRRRRAGQWEERERAGQWEEWKGERERERRQR